MITFQFTSPEGVKGPVMTLPDNQPPVDDRVAKGQAAWKELHQAALAKTITLHWLMASFEPLIPLFGCACLDKWKAILIKIPFRPDDQFAWSVDVHNAVNTQLGKPFLSASDALNIWTPSPLAS
jgi:hypothetical protein